MTSAYLHVETNANSSCSERNIETLKKYANVKYGTTISRDIIIPGDMTLLALHYTIQKLFGWEDIYQYILQLPQSVFNELTHDNTYFWAD